MVDEFHWSNQTKLSIPRLIRQFVSRCTVLSNQSCKFSQVTNSVYESSGGISICKGVSLFKLQIWYVYYIRRQLLLFILVSNSRLAAS